jgi:hypothetical protein
MRENQRKSEERTTKDTENTEEDEGSEPQFFSVTFVFSVVPLFLSLSFSVPLCL